MPADFNKPTILSRYTDFVAELRANFHAVVTGDYANASANAPDGAIRFNETNSRWEKKTSGAWAALRDIAQAFAMKVADSEKLNGQSAAFYRNADNLNAGTVPVEQIPVLPADKIGSGDIDVARLPDFPADKISSGTLLAARLPEIPAEKISGGVLNDDTIPDTLAVRGISEVNFQTVNQGADNGPITGVAMAAATADRTLTITLTLTR